MRIIAKGYVEKVESKEKKEKDDQGQLFGTGEFYDKITLRDSSNGAFVSFNQEEGHNIEPDDFIAVDVFQ